MELEETKNEIEFLTRKIRALEVGRIEGIEWQMRKMQDMLDLMETKISQLDRQVHNHITNDEMHIEGENND